MYSVNFWVITIKDRVKFMVTQKVGDEYEEGMEILRELYAKAIQRRADRSSSV